ncbi:DNA-binding WRKY [Iris pallida]|uniref:DNA-binding WRKY n=1 Tax=Iris pallida TaxID=29817 RepID=A0AAX6DQ95_IRIPA|nr:DNA-binding WRKY [Iris pallida]KAJ6849018.1 DNA-binding WRKY [Iris pallida]
MEDQPPTPTTSTPLPSPRPDPNQFPTTFVQADTTSFKQVVQMLTGTAETAASAAAKAHPIPPKPTGPKRPAFKLYERRNSGLKNIAHHLNIVSPAKHQLQQQQQRSEILSPSALDFPSLALSPVTPLVFDPEEKAIAEKGFYLIPSPRGGGAAPEPPPRLLTLFPLTSPRAAGNAGSSS